MRAHQIKSGDVLEVPGVKGTIIAQTIIREEDTDISEATRNAVKGAILVTYDNRKKVIIPLNDTVIKF